MKPAREPNPNAEFFRGEKELADYLGISKRTLIRAIKKGEVPTIHAFGQYLFRKTAIDEWLASKTFGGLPT